MLFRSIDEQNEKIRAMELENEEKRKKVKEDEESNFSDFIERAFNSRE